MITFAATLYDTLHGKYDASWVDKLHRGISRNLGEHFRFVCLTDDSSDIGSDVEVYDIPKVGVPDFDSRQPWTLGYGWLKLT